MPIHVQVSCDACPQQDYIATLNERELVGWGVFSAYVKRINPGGAKKNRGMGEKLPKRYLCPTCMKNEDIKNARLRPVALLTATA